MLLRSKGFLKLKQKQRRYRNLWRKKLRCLKNYKANRSKLARRRNLGEVLKSIGFLNNN